MAFLLFLKPFLAIAQKYWKVFALVLIIAGAFWRFDALNDEIAELSAANATYESNQVTLQSGIDQQNIKIDKLNTKLKQAEIDLLGVVKDQDAANVIHQQELADILKEAKPTTCGAAIEYLIEGVGDLLKW